MNKIRVIFAFNLSECSRIDAYRFILNSILKCCTYQPDFHAQCLHNKTYTKSFKYLHLKCIRIFFHLLFLRLRIMSVFVMWYFMSIRAEIMIHLNVKHSPYIKIAEFTFVDAYYLICFSTFFFHFFSIFTFIWIFLYSSYLPFSEVQRLNENKQATLTFWQMVQNSRSIDMMYSNVPSHSNIFNKLSVLVFVFVYKYFLIISRTKIRTENLKETEYGRIQETKEGQRKKTAEQWGIPIMIRFDSELWSVMIADSVFSDFIL